MASKDDERGCATDQEAFDRLVLKMQLFDQLICNVDRHLNNPDHGELRAAADDHSRAFRPLNELRDPSLLPKILARSSTRCPASTSSR
jgi:hypothetical protein